MEDQARRMSTKTCKCPPGMKYHANNCPVAPGELRPPRYIKPSLWVEAARQVSNSVPSLEPIPLSACAHAACKRPLSEHRSRHSADPERRNRCPKQETTT